MNNMKRPHKVVTIYRTKRKPWSTKRRVISYSNPDKVFDGVEGEVIYLNHLNEIENNQVKGYVFAVFNYEDKNGVYFYPVNTRSLTHDEIYQKFWNYAKSRKIIHNNL